MTPCLELQNVTKKYPSFTLGPLSLTVPAGCILGLAGENGAGKSTTLGICTGAILKNSGNVRLFGQPLSDPLLEQVGVVLDECCFPENLAAKDVNNILRRIYKNWDETAFRGYLDRFELSPVQPVKALSKGMKMKLSLAAALAHHPRLLLLDEPAAGLDPMAREELLDLLRDFIQQEDHGVLLSSHLTEDLEKLCDYVAILHKGQLLLCEEKDRLLERFGLWKGDAAGLDALPAATVHGRRDHAFGAEALVERAAVPASTRLERAGLEEIVVALLKEAQGK